MKRMVLNVALAALAATAFGESKPGWQATFADGAFALKDMTFEKLNLGHRFKRTADGGTFAQAAPWSRDAAEAKGLTHAQFRVWNAPGAYMTIDFLGHRVMQPTAMGFGFFTVPIYGPWTKFPTDAQEGVAPLVGSIGGKGEFVDMSEILFVGETGIDGVFVSAKHADGTSVKPGETAKTGDILTVKMPVISRPDSLRLSFKELDLSPEAGKTGRHLSIPVRNAPPRLEPSKEDPLLYTATFEIPKLAKDRRVPLGAFMVRIDYAGVDSRIWGPYYGVAPFAVDFAGGSTDGVPPAAFTMLDFGPAGQAVMTGAKAVTPTETPAGFRWIAPPAGYETSHLRFFDNLVHDWAYTSSGLEAKFAVKVPKAGRYKVVVGLWPFGVRCWLNHQYKPLEYDICANGEKIGSKRRRGEMIDRFRWLGHEAEPDEDLYETYVRPAYDEIVGEATADANGEITVALAAPPKDPKAQYGKNTPFNYVLVYPADDAACRDFVAYLEKNRRHLFYSYWADATESIPDFRNALAAKEIPGRGLRLFARENPLDWVMPQTKPLVNEIGQSVIVRAARGERLSGAFLLNADYAAKGVTLALEGLPEKAHGRLLRQISYRFTRPWNAIHQMGINHLLPPQRQDLRKDRSYGYLIRFDVDADLAPGTYRGRVTAKDADGASASLPVELVVRQAQLPELTDHIIAMLASGAGRDRMKLCKEELGCTSFVLGSVWPEYTTLATDKDGHPTGFRNDEAFMKGLDAQIAAWKETGFACPYPFYSMQTMGYNDAIGFGKIKPFTDDYRQAIRVTYGRILARARAGGIQNLVFDLGGEMGHEAKVPARATLDNAIRLYKLIHEEVPGSMLSYRCNCFATVDEFYPHLEVQGVRGKTSWEHADKITDFGRNKWIYTYSVENRFSNGIQSWAHGARGNFREWMTWSHVEEFNDFLCEGCCGCTSHYELMPGPEGKFIPTTRSEAFRASVDDRRYLRLLENAMRLKAADRDEVAKAENLRQLIRRVVYDHISDTGSGWSYGTWRGDGNNPWPGIRLDLVRDLCETFAAAFEKGGKTDLPSLAAPATDMTDFGLADGPLERAGCVALAAFAHEKKYGAEELKGATVEVCTPDGSVLVQARAGAKDRCSHPSFYLPAKDLKPGTYKLKLRIDGETKAESVFYLLK